MSPPRLLPALTSLSSPPDTVVVPVKPLLSPDNVRVPAPDLLRVPSPEITCEYVLFPVGLNVTVPEAPISMLELGRSVWSSNSPPETLVLGE